MSGNGMDKVWEQHGTCELVLTAQITFRCNVMTYRLTFGYECFIFYPKDGSNRFLKTLVLILTAE
jgi:hypothetical protein